MVWEDQGLYAALTVGAISFVLIVPAYVLHGKFKRALRPNRPHSTTATFFSSDSINSLIAFDETTDEVVGRNCGPAAQVYLTFLKYAALMFVAGSVLCVILVPLCATDTYYNDLALETDAKECRAGVTNATCLGDDNDAFCEWIARDANETLPSNSTADPNYKCEPLKREGLFSLSVQNITPEGWRLYIYGIVVALYGIGVCAISLRLGRSQRRRGR